MEPGDELPWLRLKDPKQPYKRKVFENDTKPSRAELGRKQPSQTTERKERTKC